MAKNRDYFRESSRRCQTRIPGNSLVFQVLHQRPLPYIAPSTSLRVESFLGLVLNKLQKRTDVPRIEVLRRGLTGASAAVVSGAFLGSQAPLEQGDEDGAGPGTFLLSVLPSSDTTTVPETSATLELSTDSTGLTELTSRLLSPTIPESASGSSLSRQGLSDNHRLRRARERAEASDHKGKGRSQP